MKKVLELKSEWLFCVTPLGSERMPDESDPRWSSVSVPHDWSIYGEFSPDNDPQPLENSVMDYHEGMIQIGRTGGLPFIGTGWYKRTIYASSEYSCFTLEFDGIMNHAEVYVNGQKAGERPFGYSSFCVDISKSVEPDSCNLIVVRVNSMPATSRWYPGAGIYRPARFVSAHKEHFEYCGIWAGSTLDRNTDTAVLSVSIDASGGDAVSTLYSPSGTEVAKFNGTKFSYTIDAPELWSLDSPKLYRLETELFADGKKRDAKTTRFGVRSVEFHSDNGFTLNGENIKIHGVCLHHDFGMLGTGYRKDVMRKRLLALKEVGCNAIRTTHNPPCPLTLDICDKIGMMVIDEAFDEWHTGKTKNGYATLFDEWADTDLRDMVRRDRNHPSIILYSVGNEIPDQIYPRGRDTCRRLVAICHKEDPYHEVTCGFNKPTAAVQNGLTEEVDVVGLNYTARFYEKYHSEHPDWKIVATETMSAVASRDEYFLPAVEEVPPVKHDNHQVNGFDLCAAACTTPQIVEFEAQKKCGFVAGQFVWSGYDYLGEGTPYREEWPSRSSYFGIFDLAGLKKNRYYAFKAEWTKDPVVHLFPHWNWENGQMVDVFCYSNLDDVEFGFNGKKLEPVERIGTRIYLGKIEFAEGSITAKGYTSAEGKRTLCAEDMVKTAYSPHRIKLNTWDKSIPADGESIAYIEADILDEFGTVCPHAGNRVVIEVEGCCTYVASDGGDATSLRKFNEPYCDAFHGKLVIAVQASTQKGTAKIRVKSDGLIGAETIINVDRLVDASGKRPEKH